MDVSTPALDAAATAAPGAAVAPASSRAAAKSARDFEAVFIGQMTKTMMETVETKGPFSGGHGEEMFRGVLAEQLGGAITARGGIGLAPAVMKQIIALQEAAGQEATGQEAAGPGGADDAR